MTDEELKALLAETLQGIAELRASQAETARQLRTSQAETAEQQRDTDRQIKELGKQLGGLGDKFGSFTEGMAFPSMRKLLEERFGMTHLALRSLVRKNGRSHEVDVLAYTNTDRNEAVVVEVKSHLREEGLEQMLRLLEEFPDFYPEHRDKRLYGILAVVDAPDDLRRKVWEQGVYLALISGDTFELQVPDGFEPRSFQAPPSAG